MKIKQKLPDFLDILEVRHYIKGRIRLYIPILKNNQKLCEELEKRFTNVLGIYSVKINPISATILINFDEDRVEAQILIGAILKILGLEEIAFAKKNSKITKFTKDMIGSVDTALYNETRGFLNIKTTIFLFFTVYGVKKLCTNPTLPNGVNLLWWAFTLVGRGE